MILAGYAKRFIGSQASTYSTGIMLLRGQLHKEYPMIDPKIEFITDFEYSECDNKSSNFHVIHKDRWEEFAEVDIYAGITEIGL